MGRMGGYLCHLITPALLETSQPSFLSSVNYCASPRLAVVGAVEIAGRTVLILGIRLVHFGYLCVRTLKSM
ncbi:hypothetical protein L1987_07360 [Smallanthus sonchifolius]|uniref:Uncharacterized protein n=1 Tax=Smallanthus sonchifolius TaxID=185202 RepID=A0ACB9K0D5_9ASTR|nr:hypothetical protein L1987_07360 [Smallanthus sonchifolius]